MPSAAACSHTSFRVPTRMGGLVLAHDGHAARPVEVLEVSAHGALLLHHDAVEGEKIRLLLLCEEPMPPVVDARILKRAGTTTGGGATATDVTFVHLTTRARCAIERVVNRELIRHVQAMRAHALVVEQNDYIHRYVVEALHAFGANVARARSPVEALRRLDVDDRAIGTVYVGTLHGSATSEELACHVAHERPDVRVVMLADPPPHRSPEASSAEARKSVEIIEKPFSPLMLASYLLPRRGPARPPKAATPRTAASTAT